MTCCVEQLQSMGCAPSSSKGPRRAPPGFRTSPIRDAVHHALPWDVLDQKEPLEFVAESQELGQPQKGHPAEHLRLSRHAHHCFRCKLAVGPVHDDAADHAHSCSIDCRLEGVQRFWRVTRAASRCFRSLSSRFRHGFVASECDALFLRDCTRTRSVLTCRGAQT